MYISHFNHFTSTKKLAFNWLLQQMTQQTQTGNTEERPKHHGNLTHKTVNREHNELRTQNNLKTN